MTDIPDDVVEAVARAIYDTDAEPVHQTWDQLIHDAQHREKHANEPADYKVGYYDAETSMFQDKSPAKK